MHPNQIFDSFVHYTTLFSLLKPCRWQLLGTGLFEKIPVPISKSPVPISKGPVPISKVPVPISKGPVPISKKGQEPSLSRWLFYLRGSLLYYTMYIKGMEGYFYYFKM